MNPFTHRVSSVVAFAVVALAIGACGSTDSSSVATESSQQSLLCQSAGLRPESCGTGGPIVAPHFKPVKTIACASSATCWVWPKTTVGWDPSYPDKVTPDNAFQEEMRLASCSGELYLTYGEKLGVPTTNQALFQIGHFALCGSVPPGATPRAPIPDDCGCDAVPDGYTLVTWTSQPGSPSGTCTMGSCFGGLGEPPPSTGLPGEPLQDQQD